MASDVETSRALHVPGKPLVLYNICAASPLPVNITVTEDLDTLAEIAELGVARVSDGHQPWLWAMQKLRADAEVIYR